MRIVLDAVRKRGGSAVSPSLTSPGHNDAASRAAYAETVSCDCRRRSP